MRSCHIWRLTSGIVGVTRGATHVASAVHATATTIGCPDDADEPALDHDAGPVRVSKSSSFSTSHVAWNSGLRSTSGVRGRGSTTGTRSRTRPGRGVMTATRSARNTASAIEWVTSRVVIGALRPDPLELDVEALTGHLVERSERLVEQQHVRRGHERPGDRRPLPHPARELCRARPLEAGEPDELDRAHRRRRPAHPIRRSRAAGARCARRERHGNSAASWKAIPSRPARRSAPGASPWTSASRSSLPRGRRGCAARSTCHSPTARSRRRTRRGR